MAVVQAVHLANHILEDEIKLQKRKKQEGLYHTNLYSSLADGTLITTFDTLS